MRQLLLIAAVLATITGCGSRESSTSAGVAPALNQPATQEITRRKMAEAGLLSPGTRIYVSDVLTIDNGTTEYIVEPTSTVNRSQSGEWVVRNYRGVVQATFPSTAIFHRDRDAMRTAVPPGQPVPHRFANALPVEIIK